MFGIPSKARAALPLQLRRPSRRLRLEALEERLVPSLVNFVNFETGNFSLCANETNAAIVTSPALNGKYSAQLLRTNSVADIEIRQSVTNYYNLPTVYYSFLFEYTSSSGEGGIVNFLDPTSSGKAALHLSASDQLLFYGQNGLLGTGNTVLMPGQVYTLSAIIGTGTTAAWQISINGKVEMSGTGNLGTSTNGSIQLGGDSAYTTNYYYDDVAIYSQTPTNTTVNSSANPQTAGQPVSWPATVTPAGEVNFVNFETGNFSQLATETNASIVTSPALNGTYSLQLLRNNSVANAEIRQSGSSYYNLSTVFYSFLFEFTSSTGEGGIANFQDTASGYKAALHLSSSDKLLFYGQTALLGTGSTVLIPGQVYTISVEVGTGSSAPWQILINGNIEIGGTGNVGTNRNGSIELGGNSAYTTNYFYDDVAVGALGYPGPVPTGTVQFAVDGVNFGAPVALSDGMATSPSTTALNAGAHTVTASYSGDNNYIASGGSLSQTITPSTASTTATVTSSANPQTGGQPVSWAATVTSTTGFVNFVNFETGNLSQLPTQTNAAVVTSPALNGTYSLQLLRNNSVANAEIRQSGSTYYNLPTAYYSFLFEYTSSSGEGGIANFQDPTSSGKAALHLSASDQLIFYGQTSLLGTGSTVLQSNQVYTISAEIGTGANAPWQILINGKVEMSGTGNLGSSNNGAIELGGNSAYTTNYYYDDVQINSQTYPGPVPTGTVQFAVDGANFGGPVTLIDGMAASPTSSTLNVGTHAITAIYSGDSTYSPSTGSLAQTIQQTGQINSVDFETGDFSQCASATNATIVTSPALDGKYSAQLLRNNSVANIEIRQSGSTYYNLPTVFYSFLFEFTSNTGEGGIVNFQDAASGYKAALHLSSAAFSGGVVGQLYFYGQTSLLGVSNTILAAGQVYTISAMIGTGTNAQWEILINGNVEMLGTGNLGTNNNGSIKLGGNSAYTTNYYYDDVAINSQTFPIVGGGGAAPPGPSFASESAAGPAQVAQSELSGAGTPVSSATVSSPPQDPVVMLPSQLPPSAFAGQNTVVTAKQGVAPASTVDSLFTDWDSILSP